MELKKTSPVENARPRIQRGSLSHCQTRSASAPLRALEVANSAFRCRGTSVSAGSNCAKAEPLPRTRAARRRKGEKRGIDARSVGEVETRKYNAGRPLDHVWRRVTQE